MLGLDLVGLHGFTCICAGTHLTACWAEFWSIKGTANIFLLTACMVPTFLCSRSLRVSIIPVKNLFKNCVYNSSFSAQSVLIFNNMSETDQIHQSALPSSDTLRDIFLWKKKKQSLLVLLTATATWVLLKVYRFTFLTVTSWAAMFVVTSLFLWGNVLRFFNKEPPNLYGMLEATEERAFKSANTIRAWIEEGIRWMFRVAAEREWFVFAGTAAGLWLLSIVGRYFDLLNLLYTGVVMGMTIPVIYARYKENLMRSDEWVKAQARWYYDMVDEKLIKNIRNKVTVTKEDYKDKKIE